MEEKEKGNLLMKNENERPVNGLGEKLNWKKIPRTNNTLNLENQLKNKGKLRAKRA